MTDHDEATDVSVPPTELPLLTYGITPPKRSWDPERVAEVAARQAARIRALPVDGLVIYDLQDESARTEVPRPFPFEPCQDPVTYAYEHLAAVEVPRIVYRCVAPLDAPSLTDSLQRLETHGGSTVLVGAASRHQDTQLSLPAAYGLHAEVAPSLPLGGVLIAERHREARAEHERVLRKVGRGCRFFISQAVYAAEDTRNVLSDLAYRCEDLGVPVPRVLVTLTPCGSERTLTFLRWLGVAVPPWLENELLRSPDTLATSIDVCTEVFADLHGFAAGLGIELGCNVESVSLRRDEIDASVALVERVATIIGRSGAPAATTATDDPRSA
ncbi:MAG: hypothetical protein JJT89_13175 [Nitriliruptoraceae bacterium]|nr:hypothetical protein [Nitriliruptoraceae bacterium]